MGWFWHEDECKEDPPQQITIVTREPVSLYLINYQGKKHKFSSTSETSQRSLGFSIRISNLTNAFPNIHWPAFTSIGNLWKVTQKLLICQYIWQNLWISDMLWWSQKKLCNDDHRPEPARTEGMREAVCSWKIENVDANCGKDQSDMAWAEFNLVK